MNMQMQVSDLINIFRALPSGQNWQLSVMGILSGKDSLPTYTSRLVSLDPEAEMSNYLQEIANYYVGEKRGLLHPFKEVVPYEGEWSSERIFFALTADESVRDAVLRFKASNQRQEFLGDPQEIDSNAMVLNGAIPLNSRMTPVWFLSKKKPFQRLSRRFSWEKGKKVYRRVDGELLTLSKTVDAVVAGECVYFLSVSGAQAFICEKICRTIAESKVEFVKALTADSDRLIKIALRGFNPRRFLSFNQDRVSSLLGSKDMCRKVSRLFDIKYDEKARKFSLENDDEAERLIKVVCNRGMEDPFSENAVEVAWSGPWTKQKGDRQ